MGWSMCAVACKYCAVVKSQDQSRFRVVSDREGKAQGERECCTESSVTDYEEFRASVVCVHVMGNF
jgi:hypothetical protein